MVALRCRGGPKNCPSAIADVVLLHNKAAEALAKSDRVGFDFISVITESKALLLKYCKPLLGVRFQTSLITLQAISSRKFDPAKDLRSACYSEYESESHETSANCYYKLV